MGLHGVDTCLSRKNSGGIVTLIGRQTRPKCFGSISASNSEGLGSIPSGLAIKCNGDVAQLGAQDLCKVKVAGSSPVISTELMVVDISRLVPKANQKLHGAARKASGSVFTRKILGVQIPCIVPKHSLLV